MTANDSNASASRWARRLLSRRRLLVVDTETTGLGEGRRLLQFAAVDGAGRTVVNLHSTPSAATGPTSTAEVCRAIADLLSGRDVVAYNARFDRRTLDLEFRRLRRPGPVCRWHCLLEAYERWRGFRTSLAVACELERVAAPVPDCWHDAEFDAIVAFSLLEAMATLRLFDN